MLRACRRVLRRGGRLGFFTIFIPDGLSERLYRKALRAGPTFVSTGRRNHVDLIQRAGFEHVQELDLTPEFRRTTSDWLTIRDRYEEPLVAAEGRALFEERRTDSAEQLAAIEAGILCRSLFVCE